MDLHFNKETGRANEVIEKDLVSAYREAIEKVVNYLSLELFKYNRISREIPKDVFDETHKFIDDVRVNFIDDTLMYYFKQSYITSAVYRRILKSFNETIGQLEDIYLYKTIYKKSSYHYCDWIVQTGVKNTCFVFYYKIKFNFYLFSCNNKI